MRNKSYILTQELIHNYLLFQQEQERSTATIRKYAHDLTELYRYLNGQPLNKFVLIGWKQKLTETYAPATVNSMLTAVNGYLSYMGWSELRIKLLKIQRSLFPDEESSQSLKKGMQKQTGDHFDLPPVFLLYTDIVFPLEKGRKNTQLLLLCKIIFAHTDYNRTKILLYNEWIPVLGTKCKEKEDEI